MIVLRAKLNLIWALPALILIRSLRPLLTIRFGSIANSRIGHLTVDSSFFLATLPQHNGRKGVYHWFWFDGPSCNTHWSKMVESKLFVRPWVRYLDKLNQMVPGGSMHKVPALVGSRDTHGFFQNDVERFQISAADHAFAQKWLMKRGWKSHEPFVCLLVRDSQYLLKTQASSNFAEAEGKWSYHNYRDSDIETYGKAVQYLLEKGYWVIRMGKAAARPLGLSHPRFIEYPFVSDQSDILDIWLTLNCFFFISTATGLDILPGVYKGPSSLFVNALPLSHLHSWHQMTWVPKHLMWKNSGNFLNLREHLQHMYLRSQDYDDAGIDVIPLSADEILEAVIEHESRCTGNHNENPKEIEMQEAFWTRLQQWNQFTKLHKWIHPKARVGTAFLQKMGDAFFE